MIIKIRDFLFTSDIIFGLIVVSFIIVVALLAYENRKDNQKIRKLNEKIEELISGQYNRLELDSQSPDIRELITSVNDLSDVIRLTQENLEQETTRLSSVLSYMTDGVLATNRRGDITLINDMACRMLGVSEEAALGQPILQLLKIEDRYDLRQLIVETPVDTIDSQDANGEYLSLRVRFALVRRESGFVSGLVAVLHDTTEQEKEERERRLFVSNVSHELRTPLTSVKSYLEALEDGALTEPVAPDFIHVSLTETNRMMRMITDLLSLSRIDNEASDLEVELINFTAFMTHILNRFDKIRSQEESKHYEIVRQYPISPIWIEIDTDKMNQVLDNILNNAIKYSPDGGKITVSMQTTDSQLIIVIADQGLGIPQKDLPKIFDRFYRVDKARSRAQGGTGLGLAIAKEIVKQHQGFIWAKSEYGKGSSFTIVLPYEKSLSETGDWEDQTGTDVESDG
ncbi:cell wall metabolism sensor histidine kinase VicK [Streptococcus danieliae]|uniref:histidine kinase n=1 Tax=Streptococcus danieliae TaxID=747656 RepID=A0A7X3G8Y8_9STRE|nr:cell wall metabolism sensor histidine kinase VicK [Streptococcus danieliae]MCU0081789.1 cell wall metabolism sensor histidine kinase VicK [Streptococcus danieliae]MVX59310.1 cell wall metabolism sensor histidine kinase VicK [Streptococcus danieliae]NYS33040.1 cell wall metabolism sensor histidine kinase VicK [Streptococcus danieliae]